MVNEVDLLKLQESYKYECGQVVPYYLWFKINDYGVFITDFLPTDTWLWTHPYINKKVSIDVVGRRNCKCFEEFLEDLNNSKEE